MDHNRVQNALHVLLAVTLLEAIFFILTGFLKYLHISMSFFQTTLVETLSTLGAFVFVAISIVVWERLMHHETKYFYLKEELLPTTILGICIIVVVLLEAALIGLP